MSVKLRNNHLLLIGIDEYKDTAHNSLFNSVNDCIRIKETLESKYGYVLACDPLYNDKATKKNIINELNNLMWLARPEDNVIIYFAGHGSMNQHTKKGFWVPYDAEHSEVDYIANSTIKDKIEDIDAKHIFLISDSCFSGTLITRTRLTDVGEKHYVNLDSESSRWCLASGTEEVVSDGKKGKGSPFSNALNDALESNKQAFLSVTELISSVSKRVTSVGSQNPIGGRLLQVHSQLGELVFVSTEQMKISLSDSEISNLMKAYGFYLGQKLAIDQIKSDYPDLKTAVLIATLGWDLVFGESVKSITDTLQKLLGENWESFNAKLIDIVKENRGDDIITQELAVAFIFHVEQRSSGIIPEPFKSVFITNIPIIKLNPIMEIIKKFSQRLISDEYEKAKGLSFRIDIPASWQIHEGKRPNVLWLTKSFVGEFISTCVVSRISTTYGLDIEEILNTSAEDTANFLFSEANIIEFTSWANPSNLTHSRTLIDGCFACIIEYEGIAKRVEYSLDFFSRVYQVLFEDYIVTFSFQVTKKEGTQINKEETVDFFNMIMNSLVILSRYK